MNFAFACHMTQEEMTRLIPETNSYDWISDLSPLVWLQHAGSVGQAIAFSELFWPNFIERDGCIFRADRFHEANYQQWLKSTRGDHAAVESVINHTHLTDLFPHQSYQPTHEQLIRLGGTLKEIWQTKLERDYPGRCYVSLYQDGPTTDSIQITVKSRRLRPEE